MEDDIKAIRRYVQIIAWAVVALVVMAMLVITGNVPIDVKPQ